MTTLKALFIEELSVRYDSKKQLVKAMPKMANCSTSNSLKQFLQSHLRQTEHHVRDLECVFKAFSETPLAKKCLGTLGILKEGENIASTLVGSSAINSALISSSQKMENYEIASFECLNNWAKDLKNDEAAGILQNILVQEEMANRSLEVLARSMSNYEALGMNTEEAVYGSVANG